MTEFGRKALPDNRVDVPEEYGGGKWSDGVSALNFKTVNQEEIDPHAGEPYNYLRWETTREENRTSLTDDWAERMGARTEREYLEKQGMLLIAPGSGYSTPRENANITTVRSQCKTAVVDGSWKLVFAPAEDFDRLLREMQTTVRGLGYDDVYAVDLKNARDQNEARKASAERFPGEEQVKDTQEEAPPEKSR